jgi:hypothetical protein
MRLAMTLPRFSISTLMAVVLVVAMNLAAANVYYGPPEMAWPDLINFGARPMASILAVGLLALLGNRSERPGGRQYLVGFEVFGVVALFCYFACARIFTLAIHEGAGDLLKLYISTGSILFPWTLTVMLLLPQLLMALVGGWFNTRYCLTLRIERRPNEDLPRS